MDYMTLKEAAEKWGVTPRRVNYYCTADRIPGAVKWPVSGWYQRMQTNRLTEEQSKGRH